MAASKGDRLGISPRARRVRPGAKEPADLELGEGRVALRPLGHTHPLCHPYPGEGWGQGDEGLEKMRFRGTLAWRRKVWGGRVLCPPGPWQ